MINRWRIFFWFTLLAVLILALIPTSPELPSSGWDKTNHLVAFSVLFIIGRRSYSAQAQLFLGLVLYGGLIEVLQSFTTYRLAEWGDLIADLVGLIIGYGIHALICKLFANFRA